MSCPNTWNSSEQRCQIYALKKSGMTQQWIADAVGVSQPSISRELRRNRSQCRYN
ncbi:MAG: helix-turn-helix domain-containing protein [Gammaproteobacteria bacterium]|nr:helix-turn-helix domain-containing protein [Gammaproteobacteria bacterium]